MTMSHKEALDHASKIYFATTPEFGSDADMEAAIRAYMEARGLVMVPKEPADGMIGALHEALDENEVHPAADGQREGLVAAISAMLAAAPDPFGGE